MAFLEELGKTLSDTGKEVATKAKALTETIQLRTQISGEKTKLDEAYAVIGKIYYENNREPEEAYVKAYEAVKASREKIAALEIELTQSEGSRICAECGAKVLKDSLYCGKCGAPVKEAAVEPEEENTEEAEVFEEEQAVTVEVVEEAAPSSINAADEEAFEPVQDI